jgi:outer membrane immunogenic protein
MFYPGNNFIPGNAGTAFSVKTAWDASARARVGFLATPMVLVYATGGAAWLHVESTSSCSALGCGAPAVITNATSKTGWTVGGGLEAMLWSNWVARAEYRYADFGTITSTNTRTGVNGPEIVAYGVAVRTHTALFGLAYKFDWGPVVAKY